MHSKLMFLSQRRQHRKSKKMPRPSVQPLPSPDHAPGCFGDKTLEIRVEARFVRFRLLHGGIPEAVAADFHSLFIDAAYGLMRMEEGIDLVCHDLMLFNRRCVPSTRQ